MPLRIGLFGGTFDPPHVGHLVTAVNVRHALTLDAVVLMVANSPWQKQGTRPITAAEDRLAMVEAAVADVDGLVAGDAEIRRGGPSFTADTLATLVEVYPGAELFTIVGDDAAAGSDVVGTTRRGRRPVAAGGRRPARASRSSCRPGFDWLRVEVPRLEVSSTDLRARVRDGRPLDYLVTEPVLDIIAARSLYRDAA